MRSGESNGVVLPSITVLGTLVPEVFLRGKETRQERQRSSERKPLVVDNANLIIMLR